MKTDIVFTSFLAFGNLTFIGCQEDEPINIGPSPMGIKFKVLNKKYSLPVTDGTKSAPATNASIIWDTAQLVVSQIKCEAELKSLTTHRDPIEIEYIWTGPKAVDLFNDQQVPCNFMLKTGFYNDIELKVFGNKQDTGKKPVFYLAGSYTSTQNSKIPIAIKVYSDIQFKTEKDCVTVTKESVDITGYIKLYLDKLMVGIDPVMLDNSKLTNGVIVISEESNQTLYYAILGNLVKNHKCYFEHKGMSKNKHKNNADYNEIGN